MNGPVALPITTTHIKSVAVALTRYTSQGRRWSHSALLFRHSTTKQVQLLDLHLDGNVHCETLSHYESLNRRYAWSIPRLTDDERAVVSGFCESLAKKLPCFGYWFEYPAGTHLADKGDSIELAGGGTIGLTCSTFVLAVFTIIDLNLADLDSWQEAGTERVAQDGEFQSIVFEMLKNDPPYGLSQEVLDERGENIPCLRYSPEDVIGACRARDYPVAFLDADAKGAEVAAWFDEICP